MEQHRVVENPSVDEILSAEQETYDFIAVSYTHLDVYKRQVPTGCAASFFRWKMKP